MAEPTSVPQPPPATDTRAWHRKKRFRVPIWLAAVIGCSFGLLVFVVVVKVLGRAEARDFPREEWLEIYAADVEALREWTRQMWISVDELEKLAITVGSDITKPLTPEQADIARGNWASIHDSAQSINRRANAHRDFILWLEEERRGDHIKAFLFCDAADLSVQAAALRVAEAMGGKAKWESLLNEARPELNIPAGSFDRVKVDIINPERTGRQWAAEKYFGVLQRLPEFQNAIADEDTGWLFKRTTELHSQVRKALEDRGINIALNQSRDYTGDLALKAWFPVQKNVANAMGNIKFQRKDVYLMTPEQRAELKGKLQPGDIGVTRKNWYLSNAGIPGFWPHAVLHIGTPGELDTFMSDPAVRDWCAGQPEHTDTFTKLLTARHPDAWRKYTSPYEPQHGPNAGRASKEQNAFAEAIAEGVSFRPPEETLAADSIAFMRPRLTKLQVAQAIERAFANWGKPYDYHFDFVTDNELVCSELVYKSYQPGDSFAGLRFPLEDVLGHPIVTPNTMVQVFDEQLGTSGQQLDFVAFLDADEGKLITNWSTEDAFRKTWNRPRWSTATQGTMLHN